MRQRPLYTRKSRGHGDSEKSGRYVARGEGDEMKRERRLLRTFATCVFLLFPSPPPPFAEYLDLLSRMQLLPLLFNVCPLQLQYFMLLVHLPSVPSPSPPGAQVLAKRLSTPPPSSRAFSEAATARQRTDT